MVDGIPQTNEGINPLHSKVLDDLRVKIDGRNGNGLKGSEIINFVNFAKAEGVSDADIQAYMQKNGLAIIKDSDENRKVDIKEFKAEEKFKSSRKTKNEILDLRQRYMNVALDAFKNADSPEKKAQIMDLVQKMPRTDDSFRNFRTRMEVWEGKLGNAIGFENLQKSLDAVSEKMDVQHAEEMKNMDDNTTYTVNATRQAIELSEGRINKHTDEVGEGVKQHVTKERKTAVRQVGAKINDAVTRINDHTDEQVVGLRHSLIGEYGEVDDDGNHITEVGGALGDTRVDINKVIYDKADEVKEHVTNEHVETRQKIDQAVDTATDLNGAMTDITNQLATREDLNTEDVKALTNEIDVIKDAELSQEQKVKLLRSISQKIGEPEYFTKRDLKHIRQARVLMQRGKNVPTKTVEFKDGTNTKNYYIDFDKIE